MLQFSAISQALLCTGEKSHAFTILCYYLGVKNTFLLAQFTAHMNARATFGLFVLPVVLSLCCFLFIFVYNLTIEFGLVFVYYTWVDLLFTPILSCLPFDLFDFIFLPAATALRL